MGRKEPNRKQAEETKQSRWGFRGKTAWDWMDLLIVPLALVVIGLGFAMLQDVRQQQIENKRARQAQEIENKRAQAERELAEQRAQDEALQAYLNQMSQLMLERKLLEAEEGEPVYTLAQARTSTAMTRLDAEHNKSVTRFLSDSGLAGTPVRNPSISLFREIDLSGVNLDGANIGGADLRDANLSGADLRDADLSEADLRDSYLDKADLSGADLRDANLSGADLRDADLSEANLFVADLRYADLRYADLRDADLSGANLEDVHLEDANLSDLEDANPMGAILYKADLSGAFLKGANLKGAFLEGATMPDGQKYADWIKSKNREEGEG